MLGEEANRVLRGGVCLKEGAQEKDLEPNSVQSVLVMTVLSADGSSGEAAAEETEDPVVSLNNRIRQNDDSVHFTM